MKTPLDNIPSHVLRGPSRVIFVLAIFSLVPMPLGCENEFGVVDDDLSPDSGDLEGDPGSDSGDQTQRDTLLPGCVPTLGGEPGEMVRVRFEDQYDQGDFFSRPFPDDSRLLAVGRADFTGFPNPNRNATMTMYLHTIQEHNRGWGKNSSIYVTFSGSIAPTSLPSHPGDTLQEDSSIYLEDVDPSSPQMGKRIPLMVRYAEEESLLLPKHSLAVYPLHGFPLRDATRYAFVVTTSVGDGWCRPLADVTGNGVLEDRVQELGLDPSDIAMAAVFTTQDVIGPMRRLREGVRALPRSVPQWHSKTEHDKFTRYDGVIGIPTFQAGSSPYLVAGGNIVWDSNGMPVLQRMEEVDITLTIPLDGQPDSGWPLVLYSHGTGGNHASFIREKLALRFAERKMAVLGFDQVLHGSRDPTGTDPTFTFFNVSNILAGRDNPRQGGVDGFALTYAAEEMVVPADFSGAPDDQKIDPDKMTFLGHSQGGLTGAPFLAAETQMRASVFSGTGGVMSIAIMERKDMIDIQDMVERAAGIQQYESLDYFHPLLTLVQTFVEPADPINYAPYILMDREEEHHVLMLEGFLDRQTPASSMEAFAAGLGVDLVEPVGRSILALELMGRTPVSTPVSANVMGRTGGLLQYPDQDHFPLFRPNACDAQVKTVRFLTTGRSGIPIIQ